MLSRSEPRCQPQLDECYFYHFHDLADGRTLGGPEPAFDLRGNFETYVGQVDLRGKTVLDFGTASGFLAFQAEKAGAAAVTAFDTRRPYDQQRVPFKDDLYLTDKAAWSREAEASFARMHNGFWYMWNAYASSVEMVYGCADDLIATTERFDIVIAGAVIEHLSDPVTALGLCARLAKETLVLAFTPVFLDDEEYMKPLVPWDDAGRSYVWWGLSAGLYRRVLGNLGFALELKPVSATLVENGVRTEIPRMTIVATRI